MKQNSLEMTPFGAIAMIVLALAGAFLVQKGCEAVLFLLLQVKVLFVVFFGINIATTDFGPLVVEWNLGFPLFYTQGLEVAPFWGATVVLAVPPLLNIGAAWLGVKVGQVDALNRKVKVVDRDKRVLFWTLFSVMNFWFGLVSLLPLFFKGWGLRGGTSYGNIFANVLEIYLSRREIFGIAADTFIHNAVFFIALALIGIFCVPLVDLLVAQVRNITESIEPPL